MTDRKEYLKNYWQKYYKVNKKELLEYKDKYRNENKEIISERNKSYRERHKDKMNNYLYNYRRTEKGKLIHAIVNNRRRLKMFPTDIKNLWLKDLYIKTDICEICNKRIEKKSIDHIIPLNVGGLHIMSNVRIICLECNMKRPKNGSDIVQYRMQLKGGHTNNGTK